MDINTIFGYAVVFMLGMVIGFTACYVQLSLESMKRSRKILEESLNILEQEIGQPLKYLK